MHTKHEHPSMKARWALDGTAGARFHLVYWEPYHGITSALSLCGMPARCPEGWYVDDPSEMQQSERCKRCLGCAKRRGVAA